MVVPRTALATENHWIQLGVVVAAVHCGVEGGEEEGATWEGEVVCLDEVAPHTLQDFAEYLHHLVEEGIKRWLAWVAEGVEGH